MNFLPFGYHKSFVINVGSADDTKVGEFYLEPSRSLSKKEFSDNLSYRSLDGEANIRLEPKMSLRDTSISIEIDGDNIAIVSPKIEFDPSKINWDYKWNFTNGVPDTLKGNAFFFDDSTTFDGNSSLELPDSKDLFEETPFSLYVEWMPKNSNDDSQEIVGHYNWELIQDKDQVRFQIGRMNDTNGIFKTISYKVAPDFFNKKHQAVAIYNPSDDGFFELYVDNNLANRTYLNKNVIWKDYWDRPLSLGKSSHGSSKFFTGSLYQVNIANTNIIKYKSNLSLTLNEDQSPLTIGIFGKGELRKITAEVVK